MPGRIGLPELLVILVIAAATAFWLWALYDCVRREPNGARRVLWAFVIALGHVLGAIAYVSVGRRRSRALTRIT
jgi:hypothetical protein